MVVSLIHDDWGPSSPLVHCDCRCVLHKQPHEIMASTTGESSSTVSLTGLPRIQLECYILFIDSNCVSMTIHSTMFPLSL